MRHQRAARQVGKRLVPADPPPIAPAGSHRAHRSTPPP
ncbi:hypothetical protein roselon_01445 [Roseibacterium elongatum DSM 19469]|uniref:Uncharacterized protein n=1 Tax=Roseicyclus elongatus DSM 19469 TaxID=1294273 RepID=W8RRU2_9RHOB|nr:hypothetical protein roselon_01445 [Roseibacterium elongatum DSM 19469]